MNLGIRYLNLGVFATSLGEPSLRPEAVVTPERALGVWPAVILINRFQNTQRLCDTPSGSQAGVWNLEELVREASVL